MKIKYLNLDFTPKEINVEAKSLRAVFSTSDVDRHGEVVDQKSWLLDDFLRNPVVLFGHDHGQPPVGKIVNLGYNADGNLEGEVKFAADEYPFANVIWNLYKGGFMKAFSVGFAAGRVDVVDGQVILKDNTLFEISTVSVPANAFALAKSKGIDCSALEEKIAEQTAATKCVDCETEITDAEKGCPCKAPKVEADEPAETPAQVPAEETQETPSEEGPVDEQPTEVIETPEAPVETPVEEPVDEEVETKSLVDFINAVKEGRVLSKKNRKVLEDALAAIQSILEADKREEEGKSVASDNKTAAFIKVETPAVRVSVSAKTHNKSKLINKAIRALLAEKAKN